MVDLDLDLEFKARAKNGASKRGVALVSFLARTEKKKNEYLQQVETMTF